MTNTLMTVVALILSSAQTAPIIYNEDFKVGNSVDLNQGFYVCDQAQAGVVLESLINIADPNARRAKAAKLGCPFQLTDKEGQTETIVGVLNEVCEDQEPGYQLTQKGKEITTICGREGHALAVEANGQRKTVIQLSLDISYD